jgi:hypothetical protein
MRRLLAPALSILLLAALAACESGSAGIARTAGSDNTLNAPTRCTRCGWIESKQEIGPDIGHPDAPPIYEYTVRMADRSLRTFRQEPSVRWRVGERLILFAGATD